MKTWIKLSFIRLNFGKPSLSFNTIEKARKRPETIVKVVSTCDLRENISHLLILIGKYF